MAFFSFSTSLDLADQMYLVTFKHLRPKVKHYGSTAVDKLTRAENILVYF